MATITTVSKMRSITYRNGIRSGRAVTCKSYLRRLIEAVPWWRTDVTGSCSGPAFLAIDRSSSLTGMVLDGISPVPHAAVHLYYRPSGLLLAKTFCDDAGSFIFKGLDKNSSDYFAIALYPNDNAQIYDKITPV